MTKLRSYDESFIFGGLINEKIVIGICYIVVCQL